MRVVVLVFLDDCEVFEVLASLGLLELLEVFEAELGDLELAGGEGVSNLYNKLIKESVNQGDWEESHL